MIMSLWFAMEYGVFSKIMDLNAVVRDGHLGALASPAPILRLESGRGNNENQKYMKDDKKGFTLIELLIIVAIISLLATVVLVSVNESKKRSRINSAKTSLRSALPAIISCRDSGGNVNVPSGSEDGTKPICVSGGLAGANWPKLGYGYQYLGGTYNSSNCNFEVSTGGDGDNLVCNCVKGRCE